MGVPRARKALRCCPASPVLPSGVLCCPHVAKGIDTAAWRWLWGLAASLSEEGVTGLGRRQGGPGAWGTALLWSLTHPTPAIPAHSYFPAFALADPSAWDPSGLPHGSHLAIIQVSGPVTPLLANPGPRVLCAPDSALLSLFILFTTCHHILI